MIQKIQGLNAFRGMAAILVFLFHYWTFYKSSLPSWTDIFSVGHIGVDLFFVLSGLLITLSLWRTETFFKYAQKRLYRIAPLAIVTTLFFWGIMAYRDNDFSMESFQDLFTHLFFINGFFPQFYHTINPVSWSISVEMAFYIFLPFLWIYIAKKNYRTFFIWFAFFVCLSFLYRAGLFFIFDDWSAEKRIIFSEQLWGRLDQFFLGSLLAMIIRKKYIWRKNRFIQFPIFTEIVKKSQKNSLFILSFLAIGFLTFSSSIFYIFQSEFRAIFFAQVFLHFITAGGFFFLLWWFIYLDDRWKKNIYIKSLSFFGNISYGTYLLHFPIISQVSKNVESPFIGLCISSFITIVCAWISWNFFEKWFLKKQK